MSKNLEKLSNDELLKNLKHKKNILGFNIALIIILIICAIIITLDMGVNAFIFMPFVFGLFTFLSYRSYDKLREELKTRNS